jgi:toxin FitB
VTWLIDTNVISELRMRERGHPVVVRWANSINPTEMYTSVLVMGEIRHGIELKRRTDPAQAAALERWFDKLRGGLGGRILPVDERVAEEWGRLGIPDPVPLIDALIAATAKVHGLTIVSRNTTDLARTGVSLFNPFTALA